MKNLPTPDSSNRRRGWKAKNRGSKLKYFSKPIRWQKHNRDLRSFKKKSFKQNNFYSNVRRNDYRISHFNRKNKNFFSRAKSGRALNRLAMKGFSRATYHLFKKNVGPDKRLAMTNY